MSLVSFYTSWKNQKRFGFLVLSGGIERDQHEQSGIFEFTKSSYKTWYFSNNFLLYLSLIEQQFPGEILE